MHQSNTIFGAEIPEPLLFYDNYLDLLLEAPWVLAQLVLGIWAIRQLRKIEASEPLAR